MCKTEVVQVRTVMRSREGESAKRMFGILMGSQVELLFKATFATWRNTVVHERIKQNDIFQMQRNLRAKGAESSKRMLGMWLGSQAKGLSRTTFAAWRDHTTVTRVNRMCKTEVVQVRTVMRSREGESAKRMFGILMGSQVELLFKATFATWRNTVVHERLKRINDHFCCKKESEQESRILMMQQVKERGDRRTAAYTRFLCSLMSLHGYGQIDIGAVVR